MNGLTPTIEESLRIQLAILRRERDALEAVLSEKDLEIRSLRERKHTEGPWEVFTSIDEPQMGNFHSAIYGPAGEYDGLFVALANQNGRYEADALLIAAAPDLLKALKQIVFDWDGEPEDMIEAQAAIAKATT